MYGNSSSVLRGITFYRYSMGLTTHMFVLAHWNFCPHTQPVRMSLVKSMGSAPIKEIVHKLFSEPGSCRVGLEEYFPFVWHSHDHNTRGSIAELDLFKNPSGKCTSLGVCCVIETRLCTSTAVFTHYLEQLKKLEQRWKEGIAERGRKEKIGKKIEGGIEER